MRVQILCYVAVNLAKMFEEETIRMSSKEKKGKKAALGAFSWQVERLKLTESLMLLSSLELMQLWETPSPSMMEDLSNLIASLCYKLLENPVVGRDKILLDQLADIIGLTVKKYGITLGM